MDTKDTAYIEWRGPAILLVDLDAFFASVEQHDHPAWRNKPVIVGGDPDKHGVVTAASYEARRFGVKSAMPSSMAHRLCPTAIWTRGHFDRYRSVSQQVMDILSRESPHMQQVSIDEAFLDISPTPHSAEHPIWVAQRIQLSVAALGISCSIGLGTSKTIAKIASDRDKPRGLTIVYPGRERDFLSPLPIRRMSGIGPCAEKELHAHHIRTLGDVAAADEALLVRVFGKNATMMRLRCCGKDMTPVAADDTMKSISNEMTFAHDLTVRKDLEAGIATAAAKVARRMRMKNVKGHTISLRVRFADRSSRSTQQRLTRPENDEYAFTPVLYRMLDDVWAQGMAVRLIGVGASGFEEETGVVQEALFNISEELPLTEEIKPLIGDAKKRAGLLEATDKVKNRFGERALQFGRELRNQENTTGSAAKNPADYR
ncbi:MAG: DNA polymerase IV [Raoultibacter sp.]